MAKKKTKKVKAKSKAVKDQQLGKKKETAREKMIGQSIGYRYDVNLLPDYSKITPFLKKYVIINGMLRGMAARHCQTSHVLGTNCGSRNTCCNSRVNSTREAKYN